MTNDDQDQIFLGGGVTPVFLAPGADGDDDADNVGALTARTFILTIGTENFPVRSTLACERIISRWDDQDPRFLGFQVVGATGKPDAPGDIGDIHDIVDDAAATNFTVRKAGTATDLAGVARSTTDGEVYGGRLTSCAPCSPTTCATLARSSPRRSGRGVIILAFT